MCSVTDQIWTNSGAFDIEGCETRLTGAARGSLTTTPRLSQRTNFPFLNSYYLPQLIAMRASLIISAIASASFGLAAAEGLKIDVTLPVQCDRKTQKGDTVSMHYKGTLAESGTKFDASWYTRRCQRSQPSNSL